MAESSGESLFDRSFAVAKTAFNGAKKVSPGKPHFWTNKRGGLSFYREHEPTKGSFSSPRGLVLQIHGMGDHSGSCIGLAMSSAFTEAGFLVIAPDVYGFGQSSPFELGVADDLENAYHDVLELLESQIPTDANLPIFIVGHSFGGAISIRISNEISRRLKADPKHSLYNRFRGSVFYAPATKAGGWLLMALAKSVMGYFLFAKILGYGMTRKVFPGNPSVMPTKEAYEAIYNDPLTCMFQVCPSTMSSLLAFVDKTFAELKDIDYPFLLFYGRNDSILPFWSHQAVLDLSSTPADKKKFIPLESTHSFFLDPKVEGQWEGETMNFFTQNLDK